MTREKAVMILENRKPQCGGGVVFPEGEVCEAYDIAIEVLEQPICEDAISRAELLEHVWRDNLDSKELIAELIERMPSVEPVACIAKASFDEDKTKEMINEAAKDIVEQCEDCISRESAKTAIREKFKDLPIRCEINEILNGIPSVQPARPKGKWRFAGDGVVECNKCETAYNYDLFPRNFCPNCGADMKGD